MVALGRSFKRIAQSPVVVFFRLLGSSRDDDVSPKNTVCAKKSAKLSSILHMMRVIFQSASIS